MDMAHRSRQLWRRSSLCTGGDCVEVAFDGQQVHVRNSADAPTGAVLDFTRRQWDAFILSVNAHEFDWPSSSVKPSGSTRRSRGSKLVRADGCELQ